MAVEKQAPLTVAPFSIIIADALRALRELESQSVRTMVTSVPYKGHRDYGTGEWFGGTDSQCDHVSHEIRTGKGLEKLGERYRGGGKKAGSLPKIKFSGQCERCGAVRIDEQIGHERTVREYVEALLPVFKEAKRVLTNDGTLWVNVGDTYSGSQKKGESELPPKNLLGVPWAVAFALRDELKFVLRQENIWHKPNAQPQPHKDRPTRSHEQIFLFSKSQKYYFNHEVVKEWSEANRPQRRRAKKKAKQLGITDKMLAVIRAVGLSDTGKGKKLQGKNSKETRDAFDRLQKGLGSYVREFLFGDKRFRRTVWEEGRGTFSDFVTYAAERNVDIIGLFADYLASTENDVLGTVWDIATKKSVVPHYAMFPPNLVKPCILAGSEEGDIVLDMFAGTAVTGIVSSKLKRRFIGIELNEDTGRFAHWRVAGAYNHIIPFPKDIWEGNENASSFVSDMSQPSLINPSIIDNEASIGTIGDMN